MISDEDKKKRKFRVYWQHIGTYNAGIYPRQDPYFTYAEAEEKVREELKNCYLRSWVVDENGLSA